MKSPNVWSPPPPPLVMPAALGPSTGWGGGLGVLACPAVPQAHDVALRFCYLLEPAARESPEVWWLPSFSGEVTGLGPSSVELALFHGTGAVTS